MARIKVFFVGAALLAAIPMGTAMGAEERGPGATLLHAFLAEVETLHAEFAQTVMDGERRLLQEAAGTLVVHRPGRFRWDYREPARQVIVADGERVWMYDEELAQVTVRPLDGTLASTPAMLLSGDAALEETDARLVELGEAGGMVWVGVRPDLDDTEFDSVRIGFHDGELAVMELVDNFGQTTRIEFSGVTRGEPVAEEVFRFEPPPGVDIIGADG